MNIRLDDEGDYVPTIPFIRDKPRVGKTRKMMDKLLNRYFDKVVESEFNQQRMMGEKWRQKRTMFDSYMNLSPGERRRVQIANMRGYQIERKVNDNENRLLYSFEDNVVYNAKIDPQFNKIVVQSVNHKFSDVEKRAIFDNPFAYEPVSPYRIIFPTTQAGELQIVNLPGDLGANINELKNAAQTISNAAVQMGNNMNTFAQQNAAIHNDFANLRRDVREDGDPNRTYLLWNENNSTVYVEGVTHRVKRGSQAYNDLVAAGYVENGRWMVKPEPQAVNVVQEIHQEMNVTAIINKLDEVIKVMNSFDIQVNLGNIYGAMNQVAERINFLQDRENGLPMMTNLLKNVSAKLTNANNGIKLLSDRYGEVIRSIATGNENLVRDIGNLVNQQKAVIEESNQHLNRIEYHLQGIENKPDPPAIADIVALIPRQGEMRIDEVMEFLRNQFNDFLRQCLEQNSFIQQFVSAELSRAYEEVNKRLIESFNRFTPLLENVSNEVKNTNQNLLALGNAIENEEEKTRDRLTDGIIALDKRLADNQTQTGNLLTDGINALGTQMAEGQTQTRNLLTDATNVLDKRLADNQTQTGNLLTEGINALGTQMVEGQTQTRNLLTDTADAMDKRLADNQTRSEKLLTDATNALGTQMAEGQTRSEKLLTDATNALGTQMAEGQTQNRKLITEGINALGTQMVNNQQAIMNQQQYNQYMDERKMGAFQGLYNMMYEAYVQLMNRPQIQPVIYLENRQPEIVNTNRFTPEAIDQVNRATALIEEVENNNPTNNEMEREETRNDFIAFSSLLYRNFDNDDFSNFADNLGFARLFRAYRERNENGSLMNFFIRLANRKDITPEYLREAAEFIKHNDVVDESYEQYLRDTFNKIQHMFIY